MRRSPSPTYDLDLKHRQFVGIDSLDLGPIRRGHEGDTFVPIDPESFAERLRELGFADTKIDRTDYHFRYATRKPGSRS